MIVLSRAASPLRDAIYVGLSVLMCFIASAYFIYNQASARNNLHNRQRLESIAWRTSTALDAIQHDALSRTPIEQVLFEDHVKLQKPLLAVKLDEPIISRIFTVSFVDEVPRMIVDSEGFPPRSWERLPLEPGKSGDFTKETILFCALSVHRTGKGWVGEISYPGSSESLVLAMVPIVTGPGDSKGILVVESSSEKLQPTLASLRAAALSSVLIGFVVSLTVSLAVYSYRRRNIVDAERLAIIEQAERALIQTIGEAIYHLDPETGKIEWQGNLIGSGWGDASDMPSSRATWMNNIHPSDLPRYRQTLSTEAQAKWNVEYRIIGKDGNVHWLLDRGQNIEFSNRHSLSVGTILNLTPLRQTEQRLRDVVDAAGEYIWEVDAGGLYIYLSDRVTDVLGYSPAQLIGTHPLSIVPQDDLDAVRSQSQKIVAECAIFRDFEHRMVRADGAVIWLSVNGVPVRDPAGNLTGYRGAGLDITLRKNAETELIREKEAAQTADRAKSEFLAVMSHEIRTPLNSVLGFADLLTDTDINTKQLEYVETLRRSGDALLVLLNDILDFSRIESGKMPIQPTAVDLRACLRDVADLYRATAVSKGLALEVQVAEDVPESICTDTGRLRQILLNLVGNSVKFTASGHVTVKAHRGGNDPNDGRFPIRIEVSDSGIGIPPDKVSRLFKPFSQADSSTTRRYGGTGLGLAICKRLARLLGGDAQLLESSHAGSTFALDLPVVSVPNGDPSVVSEAVTPGTYFGPFPPARVLVVEDNRVNLLLAQQLLHSLGVDSDGAEDGLAACKVHEATPYDIIFMDLQMPVMDGMVATQRIRSTEANGTRRAWIIALTADAMAGDRDRCLSAGMNDYLSKPIRRENLAAAVDRAMQVVASV